MNLKSTALTLLGRLTQAQALAAAALFRLKPTAPIPAASDIQRVLVVRLDETIGDTVMFSPFLRELRRALPSAEITLVINEARTDMYEACPHVDRVFPTSLGCAASRSVFARPFNSRRLIRRVIGNGRFDVAVAPRVDYDHHSAFIVAASGAPVRVGFGAQSTQRKAVVNRGVDRLFTHTLVSAPHRHESDRVLDLLSLMGMKFDDAQPELWISEESSRLADEYLAANDLRDFVVVAPTGGHSALKQWPTKRYGDLAEQLLTDDPVVFIGAPSDRALIDELPDSVRNRIHVAIGSLRVMETAAMIRRAKGFVGADSGMSHVAAAAGIPTVSVFGPTCIHAFSPRGPSSSVVSLDLACSPCNRNTEIEIDRCDSCIFSENRCMTGVAAESVLERLSLRC